MSRTYDISDWLINKLPAINKLYTNHNAEYDFDILQNISVYHENLTKLCKILYDVIENDPLNYPLKNDYLTEIKAVYEHLYQAAEEINNITPSSLPHTHSGGCVDNKKDKVSPKVKAPPKKKALPKVKAPLVKTSVDDSKNKFTGRVFVFSGFTSKELEEKIIKQGGKVSKTITKPATDLIAKDKSASSVKINTAKERGMTIYSIDEFSRII